MVWCKRQHGGGGIDNPIIATDAESFLKAIRTAQPGQTVQANNVELTTDDAGIAFTKDIAIKGLIKVVEPTASSSNIATVSDETIVEKTGTITLFQIISNASIDFSDLTIIVADNLVDNFSSVIDVQSGSIKADGLKITAETQTTTVNGIFIGQHISTDAVSITNSAVKIDIDANNENGPKIAENIEEGNDEAITELPYDVSETESFMTTLEEYGKVRLIKNIDLTEFRPSTNKTYKIFLNNQTLTVSSPENSVMMIAPGSDITFIGGTLNANRDSSDPDFSTIMIYENATLTLDSTILNTNLSGIWPYQNNAKLFVKNESQINSNGSFNIATNANKDTETGLTPTGVEIHLENSTLTNNYLTPLCVNIDATVDIKCCHLTGNHITALFRGGKATITDSTLKSTGTFSNPLRFDGIWGDGSLVAYATLVIGDTHSDNYDYPASVTLNNTTITMGQTESNQNQGKEIFIASDGTYDAALVTDNAEQADFNRTENGYWGADCSVTYNGNTTQLPDNTTETTEP